MCSNLKYLFKTWGKPNAKNFDDAGQDWNKIGQEPTADYNYRYNMYLGAKVSRLVRAKRL